MTTDYLNQSARTVSPNFYKEMFSPWEITAVLQQAVDAGQLADQVKKALFYGKQPDEAVFNSLLLGGMYEHLDAELDHLDTDVVHSILGTITEAAELAELLLKAMKTGEQINRDDLIDETGDHFWYHALLLRKLDTNFDEVALKNLRKLMARFPDKFDETRANVRNLDEERKALRGDS